MYATNLYKNFFIRPPTQITEIDIFQEFRQAWLEVLMEELQAFPDVPIITLGEPLLTALVTGPASCRVRDYWGYTPAWGRGIRGPFEYVRAGENRLERRFFPFPHQPGLNKPFYRGTLDAYTAFVRSEAF